jgi:hypothetical protein
LAIGTVLFGFKYIRTGIVAKALRFVFILADCVGQMGAVVEYVRHSSLLSFVNFGFWIGTFLDVHGPFFPDLGKGSICTKMSFKAMPPETGLRGVNHSAVPGRTPGLCGGTAFKKEVLI